MLDMKSVSSALKLDDNGIWYAKSDQDISYPIDGNENCFVVEDNSFWFKHRNNCITSIIKSYPPMNNGTIFDIGGGNGFVSLGIYNAGFDVALVEPGKAGVINAKNRGLKNVICATTKTAKFKENSLPAVGIFDVLEHIEDDLDFLKSVNHLMTSGGYLYLTVPAYSFLWSREDVLAGHFRRYNSKEISSVLRSAGFNIKFSSYFFRFLPIPVFFLRTLPYKFGFSKRSRKEVISRDHIVKKGLMSRVVDYILRQEIKNINKTKSMLFGGSCLIIAKKI